MKIGLYTLVTDVYDFLQATVHTEEAHAVTYLREEFKASASFFEGRFTQDELDELPDDEFRDLLNDHDVSTIIDYHELEV